MKLSRVKGLGFSFALVAVMAVGSAYAGGKMIDDTQLSYRNVPLTDEKDVAPPPVKFIDAAPGTAKRFQRSYENAPPMIPHSTDGLLPITKDNNACLSCHLPANAKEANATPIPPTHFKDFFASTKEKLKSFKGASQIHQGKDDIAPQRFNCSQCHAPQANVKPLVANKFKPEFRNPENRFKSSLLDQLNEGVK